MTEAHLFELLRFPADRVASLLRWQAGDVADAALAAALLLAVAGSAASLVAEVRSRETGRKAQRTAGLLLLCLGLGGGAAEVFLPALWPYAALLGLILLQSAFRVGWKRCTPVHRRGLLVWGILAGLAALLPAFAARSAVAALSERAGSEARDAADRGSQAEREAERRAAVLAASLAASPDAEGLPGLQRFAVERQARFLIIAGLDGVVTARSHRPKLAGDLLTASLPWAPAALAGREVQGLYRDERGLPVAAAARSIGSQAGVKGVAVAGIPLDEAFLQQLAGDGGTAFALRAADGERIAEAGGTGAALSFFRSAGFDTAAKAGTAAFESDAHGRRVAVRSVRIPYSDGLGSVTLYAAAPRP